MPGKIYHGKLVNSSIGPESRAPGRIIWRFGEDAYSIRISITSLPSKTVYEEGDTLDLAGIVVTAMLSNGKMRDVTEQCQFDPADSSVLENIGFVSITASLIQGNKVLSDMCEVEVREPMHVLVTAGLSIPDGRTYYLRAGQAVAHSFFVDWGDGSELESFEAQGTPSMFCTDFSAPHVWATPGSYTLRILSVDPDCAFNLGWTPYILTGSNEKEYPIWRIDGKDVRGYYTFLGDDTGVNSPLTSLDINCGGAMINYYAFYQTTQLTNVMLRKLVDPKDAAWRSYIRNGAFQGAAMSSIAFPSTAKYIQGHTFDNCKDLVSVHLSDTLKRIYYYAFANCTSLTDVYYDGTPEQWAAITIGEGNEPLQNATMHYSNS